MASFSLKDLWSTQREHPLGKKVIYALESGDETPIPELPVAFIHSFLSLDGVLCRSWNKKPVQVEQIVVPDKFIQLALCMSHDTPLAAHPGRDKTLVTARKKVLMANAPQRCGSTRVRRKERCQCCNTIYLTLIGI